MPTVRWLGKDINPNLYNILGEKFYTGYKYGDVVKMSLGRLGYVTNCDADYNEENPGVTVWYYDDFYARMHPLDPWSSLPIETSVKIAYVQPTDPNPEFVARIVPDIEKARELFKMTERALHGKYFR